MPYQYVVEYVPQTIDVIDFTDRGVEKLYEWDSVQTQTPMPLLDSNLFYFCFPAAWRRGRRYLRQVPPYHFRRAVHCGFCNHLMGIYQDLLAGRSPGTLPYALISISRGRESLSESSRFQYDKGLLEQAV